MKEKDINLGEGEDFDIEDQIPTTSDYHAHWYNSDFAYRVGTGIMILLLCIGVGTCCMLSNSRIGL